MKISYTYIIYGLFLTLLSGCELIHDDPAELGFREDGEAYAYVSLTINTAPTAPGTRANPTGGEAGDGYEDGQDYEKAVNNLTLFFYESQAGNATDGVNRTDNPVIAARANIPITPLGALEDDTERIDEVYRVGPVRVSGLRMNHFYHVLAVANAGESFGESITDLNGLKAATIDNVYTYSNNAYSNFVMSSEGDESPVLNITYENSENNPATTTVDLERLVARVDYKTNEDNSYGVGSTGIDATITRAMLVNMYNQDTYVLKRVASGSVDGTVTYLGDEDIQTSFVVDPKTEDKTYPTIAEDADEWYENYFPNISDEIGDDSATAWEKFLIEGWDIDGWTCIGYPKENTTSKDAEGKYYSTGVVFEAEYTGITSVGEDKTFFRVDGTILYTTLEDAMKDPDFDPDRTFTNGWSDFQEYYNVLDENDPAGYKVWLSQFDESVELASLTWDKYKTNVLGYVENKPTAKTRQVLHQYGRTETFLDGKGYYTYWIKHNQGDKANIVEGLPMYHAIVRNNVYKLNVTSISEIGNDIPGDKTLGIQVAVAEWGKLEKEEVEMK